MSAKVKYGVQCKIHGAESKDWDGKQVIVPKPVTKQQRLNGGCPFCKAQGKTQ